MFAAAGCYHGSRLASLQLHAFHLSAERGLVQGALHLHRRSLLTIIPSVLTGLPAFMFTFTNPFFLEIYNLGTLIWTLKMPENFW